MYAFETERKKRERETIRKFSSGKIFLLPPYSEVRTPKEITRKTINIKKYQCKKYSSVRFYILLSVSSGSKAVGANTLSRARASCKSRMGTESDDALATE